MLTTRLAPLRTIRGACKERERHSRSSSCSWDRFVKLDGDCLLSRGADGLVIEDHDMARETLVLPA
jgi:hypothetical protein